jgi:hypothetical protein
MCRRVIGMGRADGVIGSVKTPAGDQAGVFPTALELMLGQNQFPRYRCSCETSGEGNEFNVAQRI